MAKRGNVTTTDSVEGAVAYTMDPDGGNHAIPVIFRDSRWMTEHGKEIHPSKVYRTERDVLIRKGR